MSEITLKKFLNDSEFKTFRAYAESLNVERDACALLLLMYTGARQCEILDLVPESFEGDKVLIVGRKNSMNRTIGLPPGLANRILKYATNNKIKSNEKIFPFSRRTMIRICEEAFHRCKIKKTGHSLRHTAGMKKFNQRKDIKDVQCFLGHKNPMNSHKYLDFVDSLKRNQHEEDMWDRPLAS